MLLDEKGLEAAMRAPIAEGSDLTVEHMLSQGRAGIVTLRAAITAYLQQAGGVAAGPLSELQGGDKQQEGGNPSHLSVGVRAEVGPPAYPALNKLLSDLAAEDEVEEGAVAVAQQWSKFFEAAGMPCPRAWWHGGDAVVFTWGKGFGDWHLTITEGGIGLLDPSDRRTVSAALADGGQS